MTTSHVGTVEVTRTNETMLSATGLRVPVYVAEVITDGEPVTAQGASPDIAVLRVLAKWSEILRNRIAARNLSSVDRNQEKKT